MWFYDWFKITTKYNTNERIFFHYSFMKLEMYFRTFDPFLLSHAM